MVMDIPYRVETHRVPAPYNGDYIRGYDIVSTGEGVICRTDEHWKARLVVDALNVAAAQKKAKATA